MVVSRSRGMTLAIRILSLLVLPVFTLIIIASVDFISNSKNFAEMTLWIFVSLLFFFILIVNLLLTIKAYNRNPTVLKADGDRLVIYLGYKILTFSISAIERFGYNEYRGFTAITIKLKGKRTRRYSHFCKSDELDQFMSRLIIINIKMIIM
jgi:phosphoglycerol transferase MdoB-like AlkP superfamily enzyme